MQVSQITGPVTLTPVQVIDTISTTVVAEILKYPRHLLQFQH